MQNAIHHFFFFSGVLNPILPSGFAALLGMELSLLVCFVVWGCTITDWVGRHIPTRAALKSLAISLLVAGTFVTLLSEYAANSMTASVVAALADPNATIIDARADTKGRISATLVIQKPTQTIELLGKSVSVAQPAAQRIELPAGLVEVLQANHATIAGKPIELPANLAQK